ncbi:VTT domain-containing protein [Sandarakinorhabdus sp.]|uniref:DedA family protein n=1 Tax=Sandarakinorhabdus sp. TaxID=1916663 RepID=UPI00286D9D55|nr:VTT domain-containing protein [Sandarakinorhabdus sp.]
MDNFLADLLAAQMLGPAALFFALVVATFVLEDVATVAAGLLAGQRVIDPATAITAVVVGTVVGDLALYGVGRWLGGTRLAARLRARGSGGVEAQLRRRGLLAVAAARFIPGSRLPVFFASGVVALPVVALTTTIVITTLIWTPALFFASSQAGGTVLAALTPATIALAASLLALVFFAPRLVTRLRTARAVAA